MTTASAPATDAGVAGVTVQLSSTTRGASGLAAAVLGLAFVVSGVGNMLGHVDASGLRHLQFIRRAQGLGFSLEEIAEIFRHAKAGRSPCPTVRDIVARRVPQVAGQLEALVATHERMRRALARWRRLPDQVPTGDAVCALIDSEAAAPPRRRARSERHSTKETTT